MTTETTNTETLLEAWIDAETEAMNLQIAADETGLTREEWLYRMGLVNAAKVAAEAAWKAYEDVAFFPAPELG